MTSSVEMGGKHEAMDTSELANELEEQLKLNSKHETQGSGELKKEEEMRNTRNMKKSFSVDDINKNNNGDNNYIIKILVALLCLLITYSVIVSTVALMIALDASSSSSSTSCDCSLTGLAQQSELTAINDVGDSGFCKIVDYCFHLEATRNPTMSPSKYPTMNPSSNPSLNPSMNPTSNPSSNPSINPSFNPSMSPSYGPTMHPSQNPSSNPTKYPTFEPTVEPTTEPTMEPTTEPSKSPTYFDGYFVGDFKFSLKNDDHGFWKLCNGDILLIDGPYASLFHVIGFQFGLYNDTNTSKMYFKLPDVSGTTMAVAGNGYLIGDTVGSKNMTLTDNELPSHSHYTMYSGNDQTHFGGPCNGNGPNEALAIGQAALGHNLCSHTGRANTWTSSLTGSGHSFELYQPTTFIGNLFVYTNVAI